jgi:hypothetical protein
MAERPANRGRNIRRDDGANGESSLRKIESGLTAIKRKTNSQAGLAVEKFLAANKSDQRVAGEQPDRSSCNVHGDHF